MKTEIIEVSPTQKEIKIEIEAEAVKEVYNKVSQKFARVAQVPGFRKGFAPVDIVRLRFKDEIQSEVMQELISSRVTEAIQENNINPLIEPQLHLDDAENLKINGSQPISLHVHVEVMPEIPTPDYKGFEITRRIRPLKEGEIERIIEERRKQYSSLIPVENRSSEEGDTVIVDLEGTFEGEPDSEPIKAVDLEIPLGDEVIERSFTENLVGVKEDEDKEFTVSYAEDFTSPALAGKTVNYKAKIKSIGKVELPELDDEWAQSLGEDFSSMSDLREKLSKDLELVSASESDNRLRSELIAQLIEKHDFEVPNALIDSQARILLNNFAQDLSQRGVDLNKVEKDFVEMAYAQMRTQAERDVKGAILLEKVADLENVKITEEEIAEEINRMAQQYSVSPEDIRASLSQQSGEASISSSLRTRKAVEALVNNANITDGEWIDETQTLKTEEGEKKENSSEIKKTAEESKIEEKKTKITETKKKPAKNKNLKVNS
jgi:trigger factor